LYGSNDANNDDDAGTWVRVDAQSNINWNVSSLAKDKKEFTIPTTEPYRWYKIVIFGAVRNSPTPPDFVCIRRFQLCGVENRTTVKESEVDFIYTFHPATMGGLHLL
jgi:hypothetical protein